MISGDAATSETGRPSMTDDEDPPVKTESRSKARGWPRRPSPLHVLSHLSASQGQGALGWWVSGDIIIWGV